MTALSKKMDEKKQQIRENVLDEIPAGTEISDEKLWQLI